MTRIGSDRFYLTAGLDRDAVSPQQEDLMERRHLTGIKRDLSSAHSRRRVLGAATGGTIAGIGSTLLGRTGTQRVAAQGTPTPTPGGGTVHVRPRLHGLAVDGDEMKDLIEGVRVMKDRDDDVPTS
jgi:hypothetical protein